MMLSFTQHWLQQIKTIGMLLTRVSQGRPGQTDIEVNDLERRKREKGKA